MGSEICLLSLIFFWWLGGVWSQDVEPFAKQFLRPPWLNFPWNLEIHFLFIPFIFALFLMILSSFFDTWSWFRFQILLVSNIELISLLFSLLIGEIFQLWWYFFTFHFFNIIFESLIFLFIFKKFRYLLNFLLIWHKFIGKTVLTWYKFWWQFHLTQQLTSLIRSHIVMFLRWLYLLFRLSYRLQISHFGKWIIILRSFVYFWKDIKLFKRLCLSVDIFESELVDKIFLSLLGLLLKLPNILNLLQIYIPKYIH